VSQHRRIGVTALGDPRDPRTWSGCAAALVPALERQGLEVVGIDAGARRVRGSPWALHYHARRWRHSPPSARRDLGLQRLLTAPGYRSDYHWDLRLRQHRAHRVARVARHADLDVLLHLAPNAIGADPIPGVRELAYLDATWASQTRHRVPGGEARYPAALVEEGTAFERRSHARLEHVFAMGGWLVDEFAALGVAPERMTNVGTGIVGGDHDLALDPVPGRMLIAVKDMVEERGVTTAVEAVQRARRVRHDLTLVVVGHPSYPERFGHLPGVEAHGYVGRGQLDEELDRASLLVLPASYQAWGMIFVEALAARTPVVALDRLATPEITESGSFGFLVEEQDPDLVAAAVLDAFSDLPRLRKMGEEGRRSVLDRFSWEAVAATMAGVIEQGDARRAAVAGP